MRLSDIMSRLELSFYPQVALVIFLVVFASVMIRTFSRSRAGAFDHAASLPLEDDATFPFPPAPPPPLAPSDRTFHLNGSKT